MLQHGDGRAVGVPVRKALLELGGVILAQQINPLTQKTPIGEAEHCLSNYRGSLQFQDAVQNLPGPSCFLTSLLVRHRLHECFGSVLLGGYVSIGVDVHADDVVGMPCQDLYDLEVT